MQTSDPGATGSLGHRGPEHADHRLNQRAGLGQVGRADQAGQGRWAFGMDRMFWEAQNKKGRAMGAKPSFILPELIRCQMQTNTACPPAPGLQQPSFTRRLACFWFLQSY